MGNSSAIALLLPNTPTPGKAIEQKKLQDVGGNSAMTMQQYGNNDDNRNLNNAGNLNNHSNDNRTYDNRKANAGEEGGWAPPSCRRPSCSCPTVAPPATPQHPNTPTNITNTPTNMTL